MSRSFLDDPNARKKARALILREIEGKVQSGDWAGACKLMGVNPKVALASQRAFSSTLADAGIDYSSNVLTRFIASRKEHSGRFLAEDAAEAFDSDDTERPRSHRLTRGRDAFDAVERSI